jgi:hypothetical protein
VAGIVVAIVAAEEIRRLRNSLAKRGRSPPALRWPRTAPTSGGARSGLHAFALRDHHVLRVLWVRGTISNVTPVLVTNASSKIPDAHTAEVRWAFRCADAVQSDPEGYGA